MKIKNTHTYTDKKTALEQAVEIVGSQLKLAKKCGVVQQSVFGWLRHGLPANRVLSVEKATNKLITRYQLRPDLYPRS